MIRDAGSAIRSGYVAPITLGVISANTIRKKATTAVAIVNTSWLLPKAEIAIDVTSAVINAFRSVLAMSMSDNMRSV